MQSPYLVYAFDPEYLEWCINNIGTFFINDLEQLQNFGVLKIREGYSIHREVGIPNICALIDEFETIQDLTSYFGIANIKYRFENEVIALNEGKKRRLS